MLSDRPYMRRDYPRERTSATIWLVASLVAAYALELVLSAGWLTDGAEKIGALALTVRSLQLGHVWTLVTHALVHVPSDPLGFGLMIVGIVLVGRELEPHIGAPRLSAVFLGATLLGGLSWAAVHVFHGGAHLGASAGLMGLLVVLACLYPDQEITFLAFFVIPVSVRPRYFILGLAALEMVGLGLFEIPGAPVPLGLAPSAHLGGMLAGWLFFRFIHAQAGWDRASALRWPKWLKSRPAAAASRPLPDGGNPARDIRAEVDRVLDKINSHGFGALTAAEKQLLDEAKDLLSKH